MYKRQAPDIWSDELYPLNIIPFSDNDSNDQDPDYIVPEDSSSNFSDDTEEEDNEEEEDSEDSEVEEDNEPADNMAAPNPPAVSGGQLSSVTPFTGNQGLDGLVYVEAIDRAMEQFGWTQVQTARAAVTRGG